MGGQKQSLDLQDVENGPVTQANRQCRDIFCCLLFLALIAGMGYCTWYGYNYGNISKIFRGVDSTGNICGDSTNSVTAAFPYIYLSNPTKDITKRSCVTSCPVFSGSAVAQVTCPVSPGCTYTHTANMAGTITGGAMTASSILGYDSTVVLDRLCMPSTTMLTVLFSAVTQTVSAVLQQKDIANFISDVKNNWKWLLAGFGFSIFISFLFMFLLRCLAGCIVWLALIGTVVTLIGLGLLFLYNAGYLGATKQAVTYLGIPTFAKSGNDEIIGWVLVGVGCLFFIVVLCCCSRIRLAVAVCKSAGQFVSSVCLIVLVPIFQTILTLGLWGSCLVVAVYLVSSTSFTATSANYFTSVKDYYDPSLSYFYFFIFATLWCNAFIQSMTIFVVASSGCMWYYSHGPGQELSLPIWRSYKMIFRFHFGSLAFGSLLLAIVQFMQLIVQIFKRQTQAAGGDNKCLEYVTNCLQCCLACVERIVQFINTTAYIQIALRGKNFCYAAKDGFELVWGNAMRYAIVSGVGTILMFLGKLVISILSAIGFYCLITFVSSIQSTYLAPIYSVILVAVMGFAVGLLFMAVYSVAMDTLLQCFIVDETNQKGKGKKSAVYAPQDLADLMETD